MPDIGIIQDFFGYAMHHYGITGFIGAVLVGVTLLCAVGMVISNFLEKYNSRKERVDDLY